jgi:hypothetical protein
MRNGFVMLIATCLTAAASAQTSASRPVLVELFTSEGCSSCPPADDLLRRLQGVDTGSGQLIVALSEHVTYWNSLGWADPFSKEDFTARQTAYGENFHLESVYTPQVVVNGNLQVLGSDGAAVLKAVRAQSPSAPEMLKIVSIKPLAHAVEVTFTASGPVPKGTEIYAVLADDMDTSHVQRGENAQRTLTHVAVARNLVRVARLETAGTQTVSVPLGAQSQTMQHLVLLAQASGQGRVLSVASKELPAAQTEQAALVPAARP